MIRCRLSEIMGEKRLNVADVARATGIHRNVITKYYKDEPSLFSRDVLDKICMCFEVTPGDLLVWESCPKRQLGIKFTLKQVSAEARDRLMEVVIKEFEPDDMETAVAGDSSAVTIYKQDWDPDMRTAQRFLNKALGVEGVTELGCQIVSRPPAWMADDESVGA